MQAKVAKSSKSLVSPFFFINLICKNYLLDRLYVFDAQIYIICRLFQMRRTVFSKFLFADSGIIKNPSSKNHTPEKQLYALTCILRALRAK
jgi:hypothetical protein